MVASAYHRILLTLKASRVALPETRAPESRCGGRQTWMCASALGLVFSNRGNGPWEVIIVRPGQAGVMGTSGVFAKVPISTLYGWGALVCDVAPIGLACLGGLRRDR